MVFIVSAFAETEPLKAALEGERLVRELAGERPRESWIVAEDGAEMDELWDMTVAGDDAMLKSLPSVVFVDLR